MKTFASLAARFASFALVAGLAVGAAGCATSEELGDGAVDTTAAEVGQRPSFELWKTGSNFYFNLVAANQEVLLSSEGYVTRTAALGGILSILDNGGIESRYEYRTASNGEVYYVLRAVNGEVIAVSELYSTAYNARAGVQAAIRAVAGYLEHWSTAAGARADVFAGADGRFYFNIHAANGAIVLSSQGYDTEEGALNGAFSVVDNGTTKARYTISQASNGKWYFTLKASNGQVIGTSQMYSTKSNATRGRDALVALIPAIELL
jgi:uncharacterized protein YegP (UPF0339 family)